MQCFSTKVSEKKFCTILVPSKVDLKRRVAAVMCRPTMRKCYKYSSWENREIAANPSSVHRTPYGLLCTAKALS